VLRAGIKPSPRARLVYRVVDRSRPSGPIRVTKLKDGIKVTVDGSRALRIERQFFVGWRPVKNRPVHLRVQLRQLLVRRAMDPGCPSMPNCPAQNESTLPNQVTSPPGEWNVYVDAGGVWTPWQPLLLRPTDGETIPGRQAIDLFVGEGKPWRLFVQTRECDFGLGNAYSTSGEVSPCPHILEVGDTSSDDQPGIVAVHFRSPAASLGTHRVNSSLEGSTCPASNVHGCYRLTFTVSRIQP